ncbi:MAG: SAM-dependent methyltransferase [Opitutales bacterium]
MNTAIQLAERGLLPDALIRTGIRKLLTERLQSLAASSKSDEGWIFEMERRPLAESTDEANEQHYEIPADYFKTVLGPHLKYSCGYWPDPATDLTASEEAMLKLTCERAALADGQKVLELGCGWGSLSLWMAAEYPQSEITAISNSNSQRLYITARAEERGLKNLRVITCDINDFQPEGRFDRVVSVEMFEHVRNHRKLLARINDWLAPGGRLFVHVFSHCKHSYLFEARSAKDWMSKHFFTGGVMPSVTLLPTAAAGSLNLEEQWTVNGSHYSKTLEAWLQKQDANRDAVLGIFARCYGPKQGKLWFQRWRIFYMACSELFAYNDGNEWPVMHYRFRKPE